MTADPTGAAGAFRGARAAKTCSGRWAALIHLSNADIFRALTRFVRSGTKFCLMTTHPDVRRNRDIPTGLMRPINLTVPPFSLPPPRRALADRPAGEKPRLLCLWTREEVAAALGTRGAGA